MRKILSIFALLVFNFSLNAHSALLSFNFEGDINRIFQTSANPIPSDFFIDVGDIFTASVSIETSGATVIRNSITETSYRLTPPNGGLNINASINAANASTDSGTVTITNNESARPFDRFSLISSGLSGSTINGLIWSAIALVFVDSSASIFDGTSLPSVFPSPDEINSVSFSLFFSDGMGTPIAQASGLGRGSFTVVPLPAGVWLFATGLLGLLALRKKQ